VVIGDRPLAELVPLYRDPRSDMPVTQFNMKWVELAGLVKFDFLGLKTLDVLQQASQLLEARGVEIDLAQLAARRRQDLFADRPRRHGRGVPAGKRWHARHLRKLKPNRFEDIVAMNALYRPGPMDSIPTTSSGQERRGAGPLPAPDAGADSEGYLRRLHLSGTGDASAQIMADYSLGGADLLRRAMGKKIKSEMEAQRATFVRRGQEWHREKQANLSST
jgi:DNA polymerase-3 subunit alpha